MTEVIVDAAISVVGLGKLGAPMAACFATRGFRVVATDLDRARVEAVNRGLPPVHEPGLGGLLAAAGDRLRAVDAIEPAVLATDATFVVVPTPSAPGGADYSLSSVLAAFEAIGRALAGKPGYHLVVLTSTVMPGATGGPVRACLEQASGKACGPDLGLCYGPVFIALGSVIRDLLNPDFILIGESDVAAGGRLEAIYRRLVENAPPFARMSFVNAELTKLAVNTFVATKITFANMLARACEQLPGADADTVTGALGLDSRIGGKSLKGAVGYGGPCFPRDNLAMSALLHGAGVESILAEATDSDNRKQVGVLERRVRAHARDGATVGILGLAYKPDTDVVEQSQGMLLAERLAATRVPVIAYDPAAMERARPLLPPGVRLAASLAECVHEAAVLVLVTPWPAFRELGRILGGGDGRQRTLIDCWRFIDPARLPASADYVPLGVGPRDDPARAEDASLEAATSSWRPAS